MGCCSSFNSIAPHETAMMPSLGEVQIVSRSFTETTIETIPHQVVEIPTRMIVRRKNANDYRASASKSARESTTSGDSISLHKQRIIFAPQPPQDRRLIEDFLLERKIRVKEITFPGPHEGSRGGVIEVAVIGTKSKNWLLRCKEALQQLFVGSAGASSGEFEIVSAS